MQYSIVRSQLVDLLATVPTRSPLGVKCVSTDPFPKTPREKFLKPLKAIFSPLPAPNSSSPQPFSDVILRTEQFMPPLPLPLCEERLPVVNKNKKK